nr:MAG TPA: hypothetical protein [Caudoviricetes sp.]
MKIKSLSLQLQVEVKWDEICGVDNSIAFLRKVKECAEKELATDYVTTVAVKVCLKGMPQNHQLAIDEFLNKFYYPNKKMIDEEFALTSSIVHDRTFTLHRQVGEKLCKVIG